MKTKQRSLQSKPTNWRELGFKSQHKWQSKKSSLHESVARGVKDSITALNESRGCSMVIVGYRPD